MHNLETIYRFCDTLAIITRNVSPLSKKINSFIIYIYLFCKSFLFKSKGKKIYKEKIFNRPFYFSDYHSFTSSFAEIFFSKEYDFPLTTKNPSIIDCGANIGLASIYYKLNYPMSKITCIEPNPKAFDLLQKNLKGYKNVKLINSAIGNKSSTISLKIPKNINPANPNISIFSSRWDDNEIDELKELKVKTIPVSSLIHKNTNLDCLILDIEGKEDEVLKDLQKSEKIKLIKNIFVEHHSYNYDSLEKIIEILTKNNFKLILGGGVRPPFWWYKNKFYSSLIYAYRDQNKIL